MAFQLCFFCQEKKMKDCLYRVENDKKSNGLLIYSDFFYDDIFFIESTGERLLNDEDQENAKLNIIKRLIGSHKTPKMWTL